jgi:hypothetical protein
VQGEAVLEPYRTDAGPRRCRSPFSGLAHGDPDFSSLRPHFARPDESLERNVEHGLNARTMGKVSGRLRVTTSETRPRLPICGFEIAPGQPLLSTALVMPAKAGIHGTYGSRLSPGRRGFKQIGELSSAKNARLMLRSGTPSPSRACRVRRPHRRGCSRTGARPRPSNRPRSRFRAGIAPFRGDIGARKQIPI